MLGVYFSASFFMDLIGLLRILGLSISVRSGVCPLGLFRGLGSIFGGAKLEIFFGFTGFGLWFGGPVCGGTVLDLVPPLGGDIDLNVRA